MKKQKIIEHLSKISKTLSSKENDYKLLSHCKDWRGRYSNKCICVVFPKTEGEITKILKFCNLEWDENCLNFHQSKTPVKTTSSMQVRQRMYQGSSEAWKKYEDHLQLLIKGLSTH